VRRDLSHSFPRYQRGGDDCDFCQWCFAEFSGRLRRTPLWPSVKRSQFCAAGLFMEAMSRRVVTTGMPGSGLPITGRAPLRDLEALNIEEYQGVLTRMRSLPRTRKS